MEDCRLITQALSKTLCPTRDKLSSTSGKIAVLDQPQMFHSYSADYLGNKCETLLLLVLLKDIWCTLHIDLAAFSYITFFFFFSPFVQAIVYLSH